MSIDQRRGVLALIPKKGKDVCKLKNWRPLTLLNSDYKFFAKTMALRLQTVLDTIISKDQSGCIKGRATFTNIRSTIDVINYVNEMNLPGILTYIDFEKAFDTVNWQFMYKCLKALNFGEYFIKCVETMYMDISSCVVNHGHISPFFKPTRGIRQGCPISANIFVIIVEILAHAIRTNPSINGITIDDQEFKISQYADDTCLFLSNEMSLQNALQIFELFAKCSGLKVNTDKSEAIWIGASSNYRHKPFGLRWTQSATCLGIQITNDIEHTTDINYKDRLGKIDDILDLWNLRQLTLKGKILVINTLIIPQLLHLCSVIHMPQIYVNRFQKAVSNFIWNKKPPKVKYSSLVNKIEYGGLKLQDLESKIKSLKLRWIKQIANNEYSSPWKTYMASKLSMDINEFVYYNVTANDYPTFQDQFYNDLLHTWDDIHSNTPVNREQVCEQILWNNSHIKIAKKMINYKQWQSHNINSVQDIVDKNGKFLTKTAISEAYNINPSFLQYQSLISAIPSTWKKLLADKSSKHTEQNYIKQCIVNINKNKHNLDDISTNDLYWHFVSTFSQRPTSEKKWNEKLEFEIDENMFNLIYVNDKGLTNDTSIQNFQYKVTHRIMACNYNLKIWKIKETNICDYCTELDTIEHHLVECKICMDFWKSIFNWWSFNIETWFQIETYDIIFGIPNERYETIINQLNYVILIAKYYIYKKKEKITNH
jgi:hypothetical protein